MLTFLLAYVYIADLTDDNFTTYVASDKLTMVKFFAPWCGHCKNFAPKFVKLGELLDFERHYLAYVDCTVQQSVCNANNIRGYPTILLFSQGENIDEYNGNRDPENMKIWLTKLGYSYE